MTNRSYKHLVLALVWVAVPAPLYIWLALSLLI